MGLQKYSDMTWLTAKKTVLNFHIHINEIWSHICCISLVIVNFTFVSLSYQLGYWVQCWMQLMKIEFLALFSNSEFFPHISTVHQFSSVQFSSVAQLCPTLWDPWIAARQASLLEKAIAPHSSTLASKIPWWRSLVGCSPWGR